MRSRRLILTWLLIAKVIIASDDISVVRAQENTLADAIDTRNRGAIARLTDKDFHLSWNHGSAFQNFRVEVNREEWIKGLHHLRIESYKIEISRADWARLAGGPRSAVSVTLDEYFTLRSAQGGRFQKHFHTVDMWIKQQDAWKLAFRLCRSDVQ